MSNILVKNIAYNISFLTKYNFFIRRTFILNWKNFLNTTRLDLLADKEDITLKKITVTATFSKLKNVMENVPDGVFKGKSDRFNGITIESEIENETIENFPNKLKKSLKYWEDNKRRAIWFKVMSKDSFWIPHLIENNFNFHHVKKLHVILYKWLPKNEPDNIPIYSHSMVGAGGIVVNSKCEILTVSDKNASIPNSYKLPGGYVEPNEDLIDSVVREVFEETGIKTKFLSVISFRHSHGGNYDCSDLYFVIALEPLTFEITKCEREIADAKWMPIDEFMKHPNVHETNRRFAKLFLDYKNYGVKVDHETHTHSYLKKKYGLYFVTKNN